MSHPVPALCTAAVTLAGFVWYVPAILDLRAGQDRPLSVRIAAAGCLAWWAGLGSAALLLAAPTAWWAPGAAAVSGAAASAALRVAAAMRRLMERRQAQYTWAGLRAAVR